MATLLKIGHRDHGRELSLDEFLGAQHDEGYHYELIDGRLYVSPQADPPQNFVELWIFMKLAFYSLQHTEIINYVTNKARVFVPGRLRTTTPEPDIACYGDFPKHLPLNKIRWQDIWPMLVVEVLSEDDPDKDLVRNVQLYRKVPAIQEYWIIDTRDDPDTPTLLVHRRRGRKWMTLEVAYRDAYTTALLPGFALIVDPRV